MAPPSPSNPPDAPAPPSGGPPFAGGWPLLVQSGAQTLFYDFRGVTVLPAALAGPAGRLSMLEEGEAALARGRSLPFDPRWLPVPADSVEFLSRVWRSARDAGGLRLHAYLGEDLPLEALRSAGQANGDWSRDFPVLRISQTPAGAGVFHGRRSGDLSVHSPHASAELPGDSGGGADEGQLVEPGNSKGEYHQALTGSVLIYDNPLGEALPGARSEARRALELFGTSRVRFIARPLAEDEWRREFESAWVVLYFGHGKNVSGLPAIPGPDDWLPFLPAQASPGRLLLFNACLAGGQGGLRTPGHFCIYPVCRIGDRPAEFVMNLLRFWRETGEPYGAFVAAARADAEAGDIRRFVFRMQGHAGLNY